MPEGPAPISTTPNAYSLGLIANPLLRIDLAAAITLPNQRYQLVDTCLAQNSFKQNPADQVDIPMLPDAEKTNLTLRMEALVACVLAYTRGRFAKDGWDTTGDKRSTPGRHGQYKLPVLR